jgi:hypothetical protein
VDLVARLGDGALDHLLVLVGQNGGHCGGLRRPASWLRMLGARVECSRRALAWALSSVQWGRGPRATVRRHMEQQAVGVGVPSNAAWLRVGEEVVASLKTATVLPGMPVEPVKGRRQS